MRIDYQHVDIIQEGHPILADVCFQADAGELVYLVGKVGTGKSSLLKTFYGELDVRTGSAKVLDYEMTKIKRKQIPALRKQLGIVFQDFQLLNDRDVHGNLDFVLRATGWKKRKEREKRIAEVLEQVGMTDKLDKMPYQLSGGEQQCVCIARAILNHPDIILADEATGNLDRENSRRTAALLHGICKAGTTVVMSTHDESLIPEFPGVVYRCGDGRLQECTDAYGLAAVPQEIESKSIEETVEISDPGYELAKLIRTEFDSFERIKIYVVSDRLRSDRFKTVDNHSAAGKQTFAIPIDISYYHDVVMSRDTGSETVIHASEFDLDGIEATEISNTNEDYCKSYLGIMPGRFLAEIYKKNGSDLLESNVRSFLSVRTGTNKGIKKTIETQPEMFFAYNNGVAITATRVEYDKKTKLISSFTN